MSPQLQIKNVSTYLLLDGNGWFYVSEGKQDGGGFVNEQLYVLYILLWHFQLESFDSVLL